MKLNVNGEVKFLSPDPFPPTLANAIAQLGHHPKLVVVEFNGQIMTQSKWKSQIVKDGDSLEIVTIVGGGS